MPHKHHITSDCLFFPDTQMAALEKEQSFLRKLVGENKNGLPFNLFPPLCPFSLVNQDVVEKKKPAQLIALAPEIRGNWIIRPVAYKSTHGEKPWAPDTTRVKGATAPSIFFADNFSAGGMTDFPLYSKLPFGTTTVTPFFIIGYIENKTPELLKKMLETLNSQRETLQCPEMISVNVWYHARVHLKIEYSTGQFYSCLREIEKPMWEKGSR